MNNYKSIHLAYFSGTGCTAYATKIMSDSFIRHGIKTTITEVKNTEYEKVDSDFLILLYPVYDFGTPTPIIEWISKIEAGNGKKAAIISISGGGSISPNTACRVEPMKLLRKKGYDVSYESMIVMPSNVIIKYDNSVAISLIKKLPQKTEEIVSDILSGKRSFLKPLFIDRLITRLGSFGRHSGKSFARKLKVEDTCKSCSWCVKNCPRNNIHLENGKPAFKKECVICLRCVYGCPSKAIKASGSFKKLVLNEGFDFKKLIKLASEFSEMPSASKIPKGYLYKGVRRYLNDEK